MKHERERERIQFSSEMDKVRATMVSGEVVDRLQVRNWVYMDWFWRL